MGSQDGQTFSILFVFCFVSGFCLGGGGHCAKIVFACCKNTLQWHFSVTLKNY